MTSALPTGLTAFATMLATATGFTATRDPGAVVPPCVHVGMPEITGMTLGAYTVAVPVWLITDGPGDLVAGDWLLTNIPTLLDATASASAEPVAFDGNGIDYPAMKITATLTIGR
jgi:hypothetical protein